MTESGGAASRVTVLVVEDEPLVREMGEQFFEELGFRVFSAGNGKEALEILHATPSINLLFTDVRMPIMSGDELAREASKLRPDLKIVFTSAYASKRSLPPDVPLVHKPYLPRDIIQAFMRLLINTVPMATRDA
jgi:CheY-like chemotaxis protein